MTKEADKVILIEQNEEYPLHFEYENKPVELSFYTKLILDKNNNSTNCFSMNIKLVYDKDTLEQKITLYSFVIYDNFDYADFVKRFKDEIDKSKYILFDNDQINKFICSYNNHV